MHVRVADPADAAALSIVAAQTFPLACPPSAPTQDIASFVKANLSTDRFEEYLTDPHRAILKADHDGRIIGYAMAIREVADPGFSVELSKLYVVPDFHGQGVAAMLMDAVLALTLDWGAPRVWLGVNQHNVRAQRFYTKSGFVVSGTRTFQLGTHLEHDYVMTRKTG
ncbi:GNAT family acetyltransferase [Mycobacterium asiaticum]|uniref:GNAT family acetyltransferase n=1 Tax=Mycobacterium asiaticum TaxID=1790 RepID=A0A1A3N881_MYCAS|nr:GNAT family N-acetyltransferase [Mycobacterium asiaticum]OBK18348.1 GNAT family acetyltransferase [Mycobacterium asiaticum]